MKFDIKNLIKLALLLLIFFSVGTIAVEVLDFFSINLDRVVITLILGSVISVVCILLYFRTLKGDFITFKEKLSSNLWTSLKLFGFFMLIKFAAATITVLISMALGIEFVQSDNQETIQNFAAAAPVIIFITVVILAPFYEEIIFRLGFKKIINYKHLYIITTGLLFGLMHTITFEMMKNFAGVDWNLIFVQSIVFVAMGFTLSAIYWKRPNIWIVIIVHALNNLVSIVGIFLL